MWYLTKEKKDELCKQRDAKMTELNTLKKKSPADLWKEDLAAFCEELENVEAKEKENASMPIVKKGAGKGKAVKVKQETLPTPQGRRVVPRVTSTMKAEANRKADLKKGEGKRGKKVKTEDVVMKMEFGEDVENTEPSEEMGLAARLSKKTKTQAKEKAAAAATSKTGKQSTLQFKPVAKKPKKNPLSDEEAGSLSNSEIEAEEVVAPRERAERKTKAAVRYSMSDSENEFDDWGKKDAPKRKAAISDDDDDDSFVPEPMADSEVDSPAPPPKAPEPTKKTVKSKSTIKQAKTTSSSPSDDQVPAPKAPVQRKTKEAAPKKAAAAKKPAAPKKKATDAKQPSILDALSKSKPASNTAARKVPSFDSSDSEGEVKAPVTKAKPIVKRKQVASDDSDSSSDDLMSRIKGKTTASKKIKKWDDDDSFQVSDQEAAAPVAAAPRDKPSRARKPITYNLDSDSDEDF